MGKMLKKKKALSDVVATVLIILLTVIAGAIIAQFIVPYVKDSLAESSECLDYNNGYFQFEEKIGLKKIILRTCIIVILIIIAIFEGKKYMKNKNQRQ